MQGSFVFSRGSHFFLSPDLTNYTFHCQLKNLQSEQLKQQSTNKQKKVVVGSETDLLQTMRPLRSCSSRPNSVVFDSASLITTNPLPPP